MNFCSEDGTKFNKDIIRLVLHNGNFLKKFAAQKNDVDRVDCTYRILKKHNLFTLFLKDEKSDSLALEHRQNGDRELGKGSYTKALDYYTRSIAAAKTDVVLALAYGNRSTNLDKLNLYKECLQDIERACANNYCPVKLKEKLVKSRNTAEGLREPTEPFHEVTPTIPDDEKNPHIQCARNCVEIEANEKFGRVIVATRDIQIGEVISVEPPFASTLNSAKSVHCHHCMELCYNPLPCDNCTQALYCSEECRSTALDIYHKYECPIYLTLFENMGSALLVLRVAILVKNFDDHALEFDPTDECYCSDRYKEIHHLDLCADDQSLSNLMLKSIMAALIFQLMESHTTFFQSGNPKDPFKRIMMRHLRSFEIYGFRIYEGRAGFLIDFADGLYSFSSLFNHSCCPNTEMFIYGSTLVMRAVNTIKGGQQCNVNYGPDYGNFSREERHEIQQARFHFTCECRACEEDWKPANANVEVSLQGKTVKEKREKARKVLPQCIKHLKLCENLEPLGFPQSLKSMISKCFDCLGNQRQF